MPIRFVFLVFIVLMIEVATAKIARKPSGFMLHRLGGIYCLTYVSNPDYGMLPDFQPCPQVTSTADLSAFTWVIIPRGLCLPKINLCLGTIDRDGATRLPVSFAYDQIGRAPFIWADNDVGVDVIKLYSYRKVPIQVASAPECANGKCIRYYLYDTDEHFADDFSLKLVYV